MQDSTVRELKGDNILSVKRFQDATGYMIEFVCKPHTPYGQPDDEMRLFLTEQDYRQALESQQRREIRIKRYARIIEGHIIFLDKKIEARRRPQ